MLSLQSPRWAELTHAYGTAENVPVLLSQLAAFPDSIGEQEPWFSLWSSLAHQGDVYPATFAAVPHIIKILASAPQKASAVYFQFPAWVEICRNKKQVEIPPDLSVAYFDALVLIPSLVATMGGRNWEPEYAQCILSAVAAAKGQHSLAEALQELSPDVIKEFLEWHYDR